MANPYINIYKGTPKAGSINGTAVSAGGDFSSPLIFKFNAGDVDSQTLTLAIRTQSGYATTGTTTISDNNDTNDRLKFCWTENGTFTDSISTDESITNSNKIFYARATAGNDESPQVDRSISLKLSCVIAVV